MSNSATTNPFERLFKIWAKISTMLVEKSRDPHGVAEVLQEIIDRVVVVGQFFRRHYTLIPEVHSREKCILNSDLFPGGVHGKSFHAHFHGGEAGPCAVVPYRLKRDGTFQDIFASFSVHMEKVSWTEDQIEVLVRDYLDLFHLKRSTGVFFLVQEGQGTFSIFQLGENEKGLALTIFPLRHPEVLRAQDLYYFIVAERVK